MEKRTLRFRMTVKAVMIALLLWMVGITKVNGFPIICPNGQTLYFRITDAANYHVEVTYPNHHEDDGYWEDYELLPGDVIIPETIEYGGNIYTVTSIGNHAFCQCDSFNGSLSIPSTVTTIGNMAFYECGQWQCGLYGPLIIPNSVLSIGDEAFVRCNKIAGDLLIPNSVTYIGNSAFGQCSSIEHVSIPNSVLYIGNGAFRYCTSIDYVDIPNSVEYLGASAFVGCCGLSGSLIIPNSITTINASTFQGCSNLTSVIISNSVTSIEENAFKDCTSLTEIVIPSSVNSIKKNSFMNTGWYNEQDDGILYLGQFCIGYKGNEPEGGLSIIDDILYVCDEAFKDCSELTTINFPNSLIKIGSHAFSNCYGINGSLIIPDNVTVIGDYAFKDCNGFSGNLTIGNSVTSIGNFAFYNCNGFTGPLTISNSVISIGNCAFYNCNMFSGSLTIGNSVSTIGYGAFQNCIGFNDDLIIPNSVTFIDNQAFTFCTGLSGALIIGNSVTTIGGYAFYECSGLTSVTIGNSVASIGNCAFSGCSNLSTINVFVETPPSLGSVVFYSVNKSIPVYVPYGTINAYQAAPGWNEFTNYQELPPSSVTQTVDLAADWNWWSTNLDITLGELKEALGGSGLKIVAQDGKFTAYNANNGTWSGNLQGIELGKMYKVRTNEACSITLSGTMANPSEHSISLYPGNNWIGFIGSEGMSIDEAFGGFTPTDRDVIKASNGKATFYEGYGWVGNLNTLEPNKGYVYKSNAPEGKTFTYPSAQ